MSRVIRKWTEEEEDILLRQVKINPQNLTQCFLVVSEKIGRTQLAVAHHWYKTVSRKPNSTCFFTASPQHISRNRKNGKGVVSSRGIWNRLLGIIRNL